LKRPLFQLVSLSKRSQKRLPNYNGWREGSEVTSCLQHSAIHAWGQFLQTDPVGYTDDLNLYAYVRNDPLNQSDSTGECPWCLGAAIGAGIELAVQLSDPNVRAAYARAGEALVRGDLAGAGREAGAHAGRVVISGAAGAVGQLGTARAVQAVNTLARGVQTVRGAEAVAAGGRVAAGGQK
jgi:uncharacterized protein RhaS with RHS repeats